MDEYYKSGYKMSVLFRSEQQFEAWDVKFEDMPNRRQVLFPNAFESEQEGSMVFTLTPRLDATGMKGSFSNDIAIVAYELKDLKT